MSEDTETREEKLVEKPKWQENLGQKDYDHYLEIASQRTDKTVFHSIVTSIWNRLRDAELVDVLPPEDRPTNVARDEFINVPRAKALIPRINALRGVVYKYGKNEGAVKTLSYRKTSFTSSNTYGLNSEKGDKGVVFNVKTEFPEATVSLSMTGDHKLAVYLDFPEDEHEDKQEEDFDEKSPGYKSGFLPTENLTLEEVEVLAKHAIEVGFYNVFGDPNKSPYPWDNA